MNIKKRKRAFTLIEVMVVLVIVALMVAVAGPSANKIFKTSLRSSTRKLSGYIKFG